MPDFDLERAALEHGYRVVCGIDEAGRGPWAGPVVAAAAVLDPDSLDSAFLEQLDDSKNLKAERREELFRQFEGRVRFGTGKADVEEIDCLNILQATFLAMGRAIKELGFAVDLALVDGNREPPLPCPVTCVIKGDAKSLSIAAASIAAKVTRDRIMGFLSARYPGYGWERNAGYGTAEHKAALERFGVTPEHRKSYAPIHKILRDRDP